MSFEHFIEILDHVPPEFERNFTLIRDLDERTCKEMDEINQLMAKYRSERKRSKRQEFRDKIRSCLDKTISLADDKISLTLQTYETVDRNIRHMSAFSKNPIELPGGKLLKLGSEMPVVSDEPTFCTCNQVSHGDMIACDNSECTIEWFHYACMGLKKAPKGKWYCPDCRTGQ